MQTAPWYAIPTMPMETGLERKMKTGQRPRLFMMPLEEWWKSTGKKDSTMPIGMTGKEISSRRRMPLEIGYPWNTMETEI